MALAAVHRGALGGLPRTLWLIDYSQFERIYYALVAGFERDVTTQEIRTGNAGGEW